MSGHDPSARLEDLGESAASSLVGESEAVEAVQRTVAFLQASPGAAISGDPPDLRLSALAGMQLKFSMSMVNDRLVIPSQGAHGHWIVKFPGTNYPELPQVECATMTWAREAGFDVPEHFVVEMSIRIRGSRPMALCAS